MLELLASPAFVELAIPQVWAPEQPIADWVDGERKAGRITPGRTGG